MKTDVLIAGCGLAGLYLAHRLEQAGIDNLVVEARNRLGGRVLSLFYWPRFQSLHQEGDRGYRGKDRAGPRFLSCYCN